MPVFFRRWCYLGTFLMLISPFYAQLKLDAFEGNLDAPKDRQHSSAPSDGGQTVQFVAEADAQDVQKAGSGEDLTVRLVPNLPPSIIRPGRMLNGSWYIMLYSPWCQHNQNAMVEFVRTIQYIVDHNISGIVVGKINVIVHSDVAKHFRVTSTPTILFFRDGFRYTFDYLDIIAANLINFMMDILSFTIFEVNTSAELTALKKNHSVLFLIAHDKEIDTDWHSVYIRQAHDKCLKAKFSVTTKMEVVEEYNLDTLPAILVLKDETAVIFKESLKPFVLAKWILLEKDVAFPLVNGSNLHRYLQPISGRRLAFLVVSENPVQRPIRETQAIEVAKKIALSRKFHKKFQFCLLAGGSIPELLLRSSVGEYPFFLVFEPYTALYYRHQQGSISEKTVLQFLENVVKGKEDALGGVTFLDQALHFYQLGYTVFQSMLSHRPYLSMITGVSMITVICFYLSIICQKKSKKMSSNDIRSRRIAHSRRKKEELAKIKAEDAARRIEAKEGSVLRNRLGENIEGGKNGIKRKSVESDECHSGSESEDSASEHEHGD